MVRSGEGWATDMNLSKLQEIVKDREVWHAALHGVAKIHTARPGQAPASGCRPGRLWCRSRSCEQAEAERIQTSS